MRLKAHRPKRGRIGFADSPRHLGGLKACLTFFTILTFFLYKRWNYFIFMLHLWMAFSGDVG